MDVFTNIDGGGYKSILQLLYQLRIGKVQNPINYKKTNEEIFVLYFELCIHDIFSPLTEYIYVTSWMKSRLKQFHFQFLTKIYLCQKNCKSEGT